MSIAYEVLAKLRHSGMFLAGMTNFGVLQKAPMFAFFMA
jgi:hypothetical protein